MALSPQLIVTESISQSLQQRSTRVAVTLADQFVVSATNFVTGIIIMRAAGQEQFGLYTLAFSLMVLLAELHAALIFTPHTIYTPRLHGKRLRSFHGSTLMHQFAVSAAATIALLGAATVATALDHKPLATVLLALSAGAIAISLRNYARPYAFAARRPAQALILDIAVGTIQIGALLAIWHFHNLNAWIAVAIVGIASAIPSIFWLARNRDCFLPTVNRSLADLKRNWKQARFIFASGVVWTLGINLYPWLVLALTDMHTVGLWGACFALAAIANPLVMGLQNVVGPGVAHAHAERSPQAFRRYVLLAALSGSLVLVPIAIALFLYGDIAMRTLYGSEWTGHGFAIMCIVLAMMMHIAGYALSRGLFAIERADLDLLANLAPVLVLLTLGIWLVRTHQVDGAAISMLVAQSIAMLVRLFAFITKAPRMADSRDPVAFESLRGAA